MGLKAKATMTAAVMALACSWQLAGPVFAGEPSDSGAIPVEIVESEGRYTLLRGGRPYAIKGAGISNWDVASLAEQGGNSFRNWRDYDSPDGLLILDEAARHGLTVAMCMHIGRERQVRSVERRVHARDEYRRSALLETHEPGRQEVWVAASRADEERLAEKWQISREGGRDPIWSP